MYFQYHSQSVSFCVFPLFNQRVPTLHRFIYLLPERVTLSPPRSTLVTILGFIQHIHKFSATNDQLRFPSCHSTYTTYTPTRQRFIYRLSYFAFPKSNLVASSLNEPLTLVTISIGFIHQQQISTVLQQISTVLRASFLTLRFPCPWIFLPLLHDSSPECLFWLH